MNMGFGMFYWSLTTKYFLFLSWISYLCFCAIFIFTKGFLQDRFILDRKATCIVSDSYNVDYHKLLNDPSIQLCTRKNKTKAIAIIIDVFRYDFVQFVGKISEKESYRNDSKNIKSISAANYRLYKLIAPPPTTIYQRLHGLTTGSLPTLVDVGNNFGSSNVKENNLIDQFNTSGLKVVFIGGETWTRTYRHRFYRSYPLPSFNVWDRDGEKEDLKTLLFSEMKKKDWDVIISQFLGVRHSGHVLNPHHPEMERKHSGTNEVVSKIIDEMDDTTVLFVMGYHGKTDVGEHSGNIMKEITSALLVYSEKEDLISSFLDVEEVYEIDLVPTIANIFGIPIPFSNLGTTILSNFRNTEKLCLTDLLSNVNQVMLYINEYFIAKDSIFQSNLDRLLNSFGKLKENFMSGLIDDEAFSISARNYLKQVREMFQNDWIQFNLIPMTFGIILMFLILILGCIFTNIKRKHFENILQGKFLWLVIILMIVKFIILFFLYQSSSLSRFIDSYIVLTSSSSIIFAIFCFYPEIKPIGWFKSTSSQSFKSICCIIAIVFFAAISFSNSYIVEESSVVGFLLISLLWMAFYNTKSVDISSKKLGKKELNLKMFIWSRRGKVLGLVLLISALTRLSYLSWRCREEQLPRCNYLYKEVPKPDSCVISVVFLAVYVTVSKKIMEYFGNLPGSGPVFCLIRHCPLFCIVCCACFWIIKSLPSDTINRSVPFFRSHFLSKLAFSTCIVLILVIFKKPLFICWKNNTPKDCSSSNLKRFMRERRELCKEAPATLYGLPTVYSATFINLAIFVILIISISLGGHRAMAAILMLATTILLIILLSLLKLNIQNNSSPPNIWWFSVVCWSLSSWVSFYGTGHQTAFTTVQWESARIFGDTCSTFMSGLLVVLNTFSSQIFHAFFLPVLYIMPYTLCHVNPNLSNSYADSKKCEMDIYYEKSSRVHGVFSLVLRYSIFLGYRVLLSMVSAFVHTRHLVFWSVFAPKLIFESAVFLVSLPFLLVGFFFIERISNQLDCTLKSS